MLIVNLTDSSIIGKCAFGHCLWGINLIMLIDVGNPTHYGWQYDLADPGMYKWKKETDQKQAYITTSFLVVNRIHPVR